MPHTRSQIDKDFGQRLRGARIAAGLSQARLADALGISFQQIQKYEKGVNRVGPTAMTIMAKALGTTPAALLGSNAIEQANPHALALLATREGAQLAASFNAITNPISRRLIVELAAQSAAMESMARTIAPTLNITFPQAAEQGDEKEPLYPRHRLRRDRSRGHCHSKNREACQQPLWR